jgi:dihydrofolate reductase
MNLIVVNHVTLDAVMQAPAGADEDPRDRFAHGGWAAGNVDPVMNAVLGERMGGGGGGLLLGRRTYEQFYGFWPKQKDNPFTEVLDNTPKYVASRTLKEPLPWQNSTLLEGDAAEAVAALKQQQGGDITILGSGVLIRSLMERELIDGYLLMIHPLVLGSGRRLFPDGGAFAKLRLVDSKPTTTGVLIARYERV